MNPNLQRAILLFEQNRHEQAEEQLRLALLEEPQDSHALGILALCLAEQKKFDEATRTAQEAVGHAPEFPFAHFALAHVMSDRGRHPEAQAAVEEALRLDPFDADAFALLSQTCFNQKDWREALDAAERGLEVDAEHIACANLRAMALVKLGRREEAGATIESALRKNPDNPATHANQGWTLLERGDPNRAMEHFREALRLDPTSEWARAGIVESLKARHFIYAIMLRYFLWMERLKLKAQWAVLIGVYVGNRILSGVADAQPQLAPVILPLRILLIAFMLMTWTADSLFNLLLRLNRFGRLALSDDQRTATNWFGLTLALALASLGFCLLFSFDSVFIIPLAVFGFLAIPTAATFQAKGRKRRILGAGAATLAAIGLTAVIMALASVTMVEGPREMWQGRAESLLMVYALLVIAFMWGTNIVHSMPDKK